MLYELTGNPISYAYYYISTINSYLMSSKEVTYNGNDSVVNNTFYKYENARTYNLTEKETVLNDGNIIEKYYYPHSTIPDRSKLTSNQQSVIQQMNTANYKTTIIQQTLEKNGERLFGNLVGYKKNTENLYLPETSYSLNKSGNFEPRIQFHNYDSYGNPLYISKDDAAKVVYLWSYNGQYPIAEIQNATIEDVRIALADNTSFSYINSLSRMAEPAAADLEKINGLRSKLASALITTYTYKPLVGIKKMTDPTGSTTYYDYDLSGRLTEIYLVNGNKKEILESYKYNYSNQ